MIRKLINKIRDKKYKKSRKFDPVGLKNLNFSVLNSYDCANKEDIKRLNELKNQRLERGFDDTELWNLDTTIAGFILPRLIEFRKKTDGYPEEFDSFEEWDCVIEKMIQSLDFHLNMEKYDKMIMDSCGLVWNGHGFDGDWNLYRKKIKELNEDILSGYELLGKHLVDLWW